MTALEERQRARREWFRQHWQKGVAFNAFAGLTIEQWDDEGVVMRLPYRHELSAHDGIFHGGVVAAVIDTCASGAVMAGHDFTKGSRLTTISLAVQYYTVASDEDLRVTGVCVRRGKTVHFAEAKVHGWDTGKLVASGDVAASIAGERPGLEPLAPRCKAEHIAI